MRLSFMAVLRLSVFLGLGSTLAAIEVARLAPRRVHTRVARPSRVVALPGNVFGGHDDQTRFLDLETGAVQPLALPEGEFLDDAVCSPWQDDRGVSHVVGRWRRAEGTGGGVVMTALRLACYTFPGGEPVGRVAVRMLPQGGACWYRGTSDRVLFAAADGALYHIAFPPGGGPRTTRAAPLAGDAGVPAPLRWDGPRPGTGILLRRPTWPDAPGFAHTVIVSLRYQGRSPDRGYSGAQLWWLRLNRAGTAVVAAGRLTIPPADARPRDEHSASVAATPGGLVLAYVSCSDRRHDPTLHAVPLRFDPSTGAPRVDLSESVVLATDCADTPPAFSADGRRLCAVRHPQSTAATVEWSDVPVRWPRRRAAGLVQGQAEGGAHAG